MSAWITDRLPTERDADAMQMVTVCTSSGMMYNIDMGLVNSTYHTAWRTPTYPEPYVKAKVWTLRQNACNIFYLAKNGKHAIGLSPFSLDEMKAMTDALNRLEEGV